jgi:hypothetical protein
LNNSVLSFAEFKSASFNLFKMNQFHYESLAEELKRKRKISYSFGEANIVHRLKFRSYEFDAVSRTRYCKERGWERFSCRKVDWRRELGERIAELEFIVSRW